MLQFQSSLSLKKNTIILNVVIKISFCPCRKKGIIRQLMKKKYPPSPKKWRFKGTKSGPYSDLNVLQIGINTMKSDFQCLQIKIQTENVQNPGVDEKQEFEFSFPSGSFFILRWNKPLNPAYQTTLLLKTLQNR